MSEDQAPAPQAPANGTPVVPPEVKRINADLVATLQTLLKAARNNEILSWSGVFVMAGGGSVMHGSDFSSPDLKIMALHQSSLALENAKVIDAYGRLTNILRQGPDKAIAQAAQATAQGRPPPLLTPQKPKLVLPS